MPQAFLDGLVPTNPSQLISEGMRLALKSATSGVDGAKRYRALKSNFKSASAMNQREVAACVRLMIEWGVHSSAKGPILLEWLDCIARLQLHVQFRAEIDCMMDKLDHVLVKHWSDYESTDMCIEEFLLKEPNRSRCGVVLDLGAIDTVLRSTSWSDHPKLLQSIVEESAIGNALFGEAITIVKRTTCLRGWRRPWRRLAR